MTRLSPRRSPPAILKKPATIKRYLRQYFASVPVEDIQGRDEKVMARIALDQLEFGAKRRKGQAMVRVFNATQKEHGYTSAFTFVEMINDNMPFIVDSVSAAIIQQKLAVHITVHPIISIKRDSKGQVTDITSPDDDDAHAESFVRFAIDRETDKDELRKLKQTNLRCPSRRAAGRARLAQNDSAHARNARPA